MKSLFLLAILSLFLCKAYSAEVGSDAIESVLRGLDNKRVSSVVQESAAKGVLQRLLPAHLHSFEFKIISKDLCGGRSCFRITNYKSSSRNSPEILIQGTTAVEITSGLHWYLKYMCGAHISWEKTGGVQLASVPMPGSLPLVEAKGVTIQRPVPWNYYQNVVTSSYSYVWWDWQRWEKEIDWMALQGINLPLAFTGQEALWQKVFLMGWAFISKLVKYSVSIAEADIISDARVRHDPRNTVSGDRRWCCTFLLAPSDPLFIEIGEAFIRKQIEEYGDITNIYNCDTFNENTPPTDDPTYISSLGSAVYKAMSKANNNAVWLMQGWLFYSDSKYWKPPQMEALLHSVPRGKMIVLDLFADVKPVWKSSSQFYGTPYIWCMLHNFGGNIEMYGVLDAVASGPIDARTSENSTMVGVGMCMEGIEHNPVVYELMPEMAFRGANFQLQGWLKSYSRRRYGKVNDQIDAAWEILYHTIYNCTDGIAFHNTDYIVKFPDWDPSGKTGTDISGTDISSQNGMQKLAGFQWNRRFLFSEKGSSLPKPHLWYSTEDVIKALKLFLAAGKELSGSLTYRYDLVDLTRQSLSKLANQVYLDAISAFRHEDAKALSLHSQKFLQLIKDIDILLATDDNFLLGTWLESAKILAMNSDEMKQYEWNARTQITMWYDNTKYNQSHLHDYANKFWSGLLGAYYLPRASMYFKLLSKSLEEKVDFNLLEWRKEWIAYSNKWQESTELYPVKAQGVALAFATALFEKYFS
ncbi:alpha-N-acetylglucosaminidase isoform X2 [Lycium barbarum]|uniref:alpha-N-acetylglucosaminidase isoform X2 n=1 Tax=Lycium barbarum TaxID=112863 RepID=UPI00293E5FC6|nr:alpha-N-acetylglucosaminidase isoform X2 [Lycium barbarum]